MSEHTNNDAAAAWARGALKSYDEFISRLSPDGAKLFPYAAVILGQCIERGTALGPGEVLMVGRARDVAGLLDREPMSSDVTVALGSAEAMATALTAWGLRCGCGSPAVCARLARATQWAQAIRAASAHAQVVLACADATLEIVSMVHLAAGDA